MDPRAGDFTIRDFAFDNGEVMPALRLHYRTLGAPRRDEAGLVRNAALILHGTTGSGAQFLRESFAGELFQAGQLLDAEKHYIILPDGIGHGRSSKPSDGLRMRFPRYRYLDMIRAQHRLLTEGLGVNHLAWSWAPQWAACRPGFGAFTIPTSWTRWCRWPRCRPRSPGAIA